MRAKEERARRASARLGDGEGEGKGKGEGGGEGEGKGEGEDEGEGRGKGGLSAARGRTEVRRSRRMDSALDGHGCALGGGVSPSIRSMAAVRTAAAAGWAVSVMPWALVALVR